MYLMIIISVLILETIIAVDICVTPHNNPGDCKVIQKCEDLLDILKTRPISENNLRYLRNSQCGIEGKSLKVCCPLKYDYKPSHIDICVTPHNDPGDCKVIQKCEDLLNILKTRPISENNLRYLRNSQCGIEGKYPKVCCPLKYDYKPSYNKSSLLPSEDDCGISTQDRILGGKATDLDEFPWMALIEYEKASGTRGFYCGGMLISKRYVLTAAHCVKGIPKQSKLLSVRLGEYNTSSEPDCIYKNLCADPVINIPVIEQIVHEQYDPLNPNRYHDIALLRLQRDVLFSDFIKPICLPILKQERIKTFEGQEFFVAGWGKTERGSVSDVKLKVKVPFKNNDYCSSIYRALNIQLGSGHLCAGGEVGKDSCQSDSGGPLMFLTSSNSGPHWYAAGIVSFGPIPCGKAGWPAVYTKVSNYIDWIVSNLKP